MQVALIISNLFHILLIVIPFVLQTFIAFGISYGGGKLLKFPFNIVAPADFIGASNFFELSVTVAISLFPLNSGVSLARVVGVLTDVPVMLIIVKIANAAKKHLTNQETQAKEKKFSLFIDLSLIKVLLTQQRVD